MIISKCANHTRRPRAPSNQNVDIIKALLRHDVALKLCFFVSIKTTGHALIIELFLAFFPSKWLLLFPFFFISLSMNKSQLL